MSTMEANLYHALAAAPAGIAPPPPLADPPHGGTWARQADGTLRLLHTTAPAAGRVRRAEPLTETLDQE